MIKGLKYKQKILLNIIYLSKGRIEKLKLFKLAFMLHNRIKEFYDFLPYHYGPYSFEMNKDIISLQRKGLITEEKNELILMKENSNDIIREEILNEIEDEIEEYFGLDTKKLIEYIYRQFPFYSSFSKLESMRHIETQDIYEPRIYTIGYEGMSIDLFIKVLLSNKIKKLIDIRNKPYSFKYGFSIHWLQKYLPEWGIEYENFKNLGVEKEFRSNFKEVYLDKIKSQRDFLTNKIVPQIMDKKVVFLCFERDQMQCHRHLLAQELQTLTNYEIKDITPL